MEVSVSDSYCRETQELQNGGLIMGIRSGEPKMYDFLCEALFRVLANRMQKMFTTEFIVTLGYGTRNEKKVEELFYLLES